MQSPEQRTEYLAGTPAQLAPLIVASVARYRHQVFVERLGWSLATFEGLEFDQFDRSDTVYIAARNPDGALVGVARLLPTHRPYLLAEVFPQLMGSQPLPRSAEIWELSRFAAMDLLSQHASSRQAFTSPVAVGLLQAALDLAAGCGARRLITVSPRGVERLLRRAGFAARAAAPVQVIDGHALVPCWIEARQSRECARCAASRKGRAALPPPAAAHTSSAC